MRGPNLLARGEIGDGARDLRNEIISPCTHVEFFHRVMEEVPPLGVQFAIGLQKAIGHLGVGAAFGLPA
jgi:hypothetical protein